MRFEIEGTGSQKRTFSIEKMYLDGYDASIWVYCSDLYGNKKSIEGNWLTDLKGEDFIAKQDYKVDLSYKIVDSENYSELSSKEVSLNLNEYTAIKEIES